MLGSWCCTYRWESSYKKIFFKKGFYFLAICIFELCICTPSPCTKRGGKKKKKPLPKSPPAIATDVIFITHPTMFMLILQEEPKPPHRKQRKMPNIHKNISPLAQLFSWISIYQHLYLSVCFLSNKPLEQIIKMYLVIKMGRPKTNSYKATEIGFKKESHLFAHSHQIILQKRKDICG